MCTIDIHFKNNKLVVEASDGIKLGTITVKEVDLSDEAMVELRGRTSFHYYMVGFKANKEHMTSSELRIIHSVMTMLEDKLLISNPYGHVIATEDIHRILECAVDIYKES